MRLSGTLSRTISTSRGLGNQLWDLAGNRPSLDLPFADNKSLVDATTGTNLVTFTRASSGTYVGSDGLIKTATTNLLLRSQELATGPWFNANVTLTNNTGDTVDPIGGSTATKIVSSGTGAIGQGAVISAVSTGSVWLRTLSGTLNMSLIVYLSNPPFTNIGTANITVTTNWQRFSVTTTNPPSAASYNLQLNGIPAGTLYAWGAQLEPSSTVGEYIPTTSTINSAPRFDHNPTTGESLGLLVEEARTNSIRNNTMVGAVAGTPGTLPTNWVTNLPANGISGAVSAIGTENGITYIDYRISGTASADIAPVLRFEANNNAAASSGQSWTASLYAKLTAGSLGSTTLVHQLRWTDSGGSVLSTVNTGAAFTPTGSALGGQRYSATGTAIASTAFVSQLLATSTIANGSTVDFTLRIGLPQLEQGAFATSVIPTSTTAVTRSADVASITGSNFSSWYRQDEGTVFYDGQVLGSDPSTNKSILGLSNGSGNNTIDMFIPSAVNQRFRLAVGGVNQVLQNTVATANVYSPVKSTYAFKVDDTTSASNGTVLPTDTSCSIPTVDRFTLGSLTTGEAQVAARFKRITFWPQRLSNRTLQQITQ